MSFQCREWSAIESGGLNFQFEKWQSTISNLGASHSIDSRMTAGSLHPVGIGARRLNAISGSILGATVPASDTDAALPMTQVSVVEYTCPQIGAVAPYSRQIFRLVKPILRPTQHSPRARRNL